MEVNRQRFVHTCTKCGHVWKSRVPRSGLTAYHNRFCKSCRGMCDIWVKTELEQMEAPDWRERWPRLPRGVQGPVVWSKDGSPRFKAVYKGRYLGLFAFIEDAIEAVEKAKEGKDES